jgi:phospholipid transport system substrate-binding protein
MSINRQPSTVAQSAVSRRSLLAILGLATAAPLLSGNAFAQTVPPQAAATIDRLDDALISAMKAGPHSSFDARYNIVAPAIEQAFDLSAILAISVGSTWASLAPDQQNRLLDAFRRYTVASYVANFDSYNGQRFAVSPDARPVSPGRVVVQSKIIPASGDPTELDYVMQQTSAGWKVVDVLDAGSISRVAVQRSDFRHLLSNGGGQALLAGLNRKTNDLSGGALA